MSKDIMCVVNSGYQSDVAELECIVVVDGRVVGFT